MAGTTEEEVTTKAYCAMASSIMPHLFFAGDTTTYHADGKVPVLDLLIWTSKKQGGGKQGSFEDISWEFYEKQVASNLVLEARSATATKKIASLTQDVIKCLAN